MNKEEERILTTICMALPYMDEFSKVSFIHKLNWGYSGKGKKQMLLNDLKVAIYKMVDVISDENILIKIYTFIKYLK